MRRYEKGLVVKNQYYWIKLDIFLHHFNAAIIPYHLGEGQRRPLLIYFISFLCKCLSIDSHKFVAASNSTYHSKRIRKQVSAGILYHVFLFFERENPEILNYGKDSGEIPKVSSDTENILTMKF